LTCACACACAHVHVHVHVRFTAGRRGPPRADAASLQRGPPGRAQHFTSYDPLGPYVLRAFRFRLYFTRARSACTDHTVSVFLHRVPTGLYFPCYQTLWRQYGAPTSGPTSASLLQAHYRISYGAAPKPRLKPDHPFLPLCCLSACLPETPPPSCASSPDLLRPREHHGVASSIGVA